MDTWQRLGLLYEGGDRLRQNASRFLEQRFKEHADVYSARLKLFDYKDHLGTSLDWYISTLFERDPQIDLKAGDQSRQEQPFYTEFLTNCDRRGTSFVDLYRTVFQYAVLYRRAWVLADLPSNNGEFKNLGEQQAAGALDPYLTVYTPLDVINWKFDDQGILEWIFIRVRTLEQTPFSDGPQQEVFRWFYFDRKQYKTFRWSSKENLVSNDPPDTDDVEEVDSGTHLWAAANKVPVHMFEVPDGLWLGNRALLPAIGHLNTDNVLFFSLFVNALAIPIIFSESDVTNAQNSIVGYLKLGKDDKFEWAEQQGHSYQFLMERVMNQTEDIFRAFYLIHQGRSGRATPTAQSAVSKQMDMMPSRDILKMFGDRVRASMKQTLNLVSIAKNFDPDLSWDIIGFDFENRYTLDEIQALQALYDMDLPSETFRRELAKRTISNKLPDLNAKMQEKIFEEIDAAPSAADRQVQLLKRKAEVLNSAKVPGDPAGA